jgi:uncharacterized protein
MHPTAGAIPRAAFLSERMGVSSTEATAATLPLVAADWVSSRAVVTTPRPSSYLLQLAKHFRHKLDVRFDAHGAVIRFEGGHATLRVEGGTLSLAAFAQAPAGLDRVEEVIASHLERFGRRDQLRVDWQRHQPANHPRGH